MSPLHLYRSDYSISCCAAVVVTTLLAVPLPTFGHVYHDEPYTRADRDEPKSFYDTRFEITPCCNVTGEAVEVTLWFRTHGNFSETDAIYFDLPRLTTGSTANGFSDGADIPLGEVDISPSTIWNAEWQQGVYNEAFPFDSSRLQVVLKRGRYLAPAEDEDLFVRLSKRNGISVFCGWGKNTEIFRISTNSSTHEFVDAPFEQVPLVGNSCRAECYDRGVCDYCHEACMCHGGQGEKTTDVVEGGGWVRLDCADYVCPSGKSWTIRKQNLEGGGWGPLENHEVEECSGNGSCDRYSGKCICEAGFEGDACQRNSCPGLCSGHGICLSMHDLALTPEALPLTNGSTLYGGIGSNETVAWDDDVMFACVCDSSWEVGLGAGQRQHPEYFGADCSLRRCPTGDDPMTSSDETNCEGVEAAGEFGIGQAENICHVDCSNRGKCNHGTGDCECYPGFYGDNCGKTTALA